MNTELEGRVAIVTGAAGGFGRELVRGLLGAGAKVAALDVDENRLDELTAAHEAAAETGRLVTARTDISCYEECEEAIAQTRADLGGLHILVNNGALGMGVIRIDHMTELVDIQEITPEMWDRFVSVNLSGAWYMTHAAIDGLLAQGWGRILNVTTSFFTMLRGRFHPYGPAKAGLEAMSAGHAGEFAGRGVTVNVVVPGGPSDTPMVPPESGFDRRRDDSAVGHGAADSVALLGGGRRAYRTSVRGRGLGCLGRTGGGQKVAALRSGGRIWRRIRYGREASRTNEPHLVRTSCCAGCGTRCSVVRRDGAGTGRSRGATRNVPHDYWGKRLDGSESQGEDGAGDRRVERDRTRLRCAVRGRGRERAPCGPQP